ncbi:MAG: hypothetical protein EKK64_04285 [Neisseriaceae bacterium]|nr:MAG: hypothetical protein EKK64_04285 [Neisseriaceae bacterium]
MPNLEIPKKLKVSFFKEIFLCVLFTFSSFELFGFGYEFFILNFCFYLFFFIVSYFDYKEVKKINTSIDILDRMQKILLIPRYEETDSSVIVRDIVSNKKILDEIKEQRKQGKK